MLNFSKTIDVGYGYYAISNEKLVVSSEQPGINFIDLSLNSLDHSHSTSCMIDGLVTCGKRVLLYDKYAKLTIYDAILGCEISCLSKKVKSVQSKISDACASRDSDSVYFFCMNDELNVYMIICGSKTAVLSPAITLKKFSFPCKGSIRRLVCHPCGSYLFVALSDSVQIWNYGAIRRKYASPADGGQGGSYENQQTENSEDGTSLDGDSGKLQFNPIAGTFEMKCSFNNFSIRISD